MTDESLEQIKAVYADNEAEINGTVYSYAKFTHPERLKVFAFYTSLVKDHKIGDVRMDFWDDPQYHKIQQLIESKVLVDGMQISKIKDFWEQEENMDDYIPLMMTSLQVICYPFLRGRNGG